MTQPVDDADRHLTWLNFARLIADGVPALQPVPGVPGVELFVEERGRRVGMYARVQELAPLPSLDYAEVDLAWVERNGVPYLEVATGSADLFREFYSFLLAIAETIRVTSAQPLVAVLESMSRWKQLLAPLQLLSAEVQTGLLGELWLLQRLLDAQGPSSVDAWIGPRAELHDFRVTERDIEVKTTRTNRRVHTINGLEQLEARDGRPLIMLSLHVAAAGATEGFSITSLIESIRSKLAGDPQRRDAFDWLLREGIGYREGQAAHYAERAVLRAPARLIPVDGHFPRMLSDVLEALPGEARVRIDQVRYRINVEGMGFEDGDPRFAELIP